MGTALGHPCIVTVYAIAEEDGVEYIVMEYVEGEPLDRAVARGPLEPARVVAVGADVADALSHAHERGFVHRDVKPANIIVAASGRAKVLDFGVAKAMAGSPVQLPALTVAGGIVGTLPYMSPEQLAGAELDGRADVFSLGCVLYEMAAGVPAFDSTDPVELVQRLVARDPPRPSSRAPGVPAALEDVIARAMAKSRADRFPTAGDLSAALRAALRG
jgi:serine/threonine-protein kinase